MVLCKARQKHFLHEAAKFYGQNPSTNTNPNLETVVQRCSVNKMFLEISQNSKENICARVFSLIN